MIIRKANKADRDTCIEIAKALPEWFGEKEIIKISNDVVSMPTFLIEKDGIQAFACIEDKSEKAIEIKYLAVSRDHHNEGLGTKLIKFIETQYPKKELIIVKTLDESADYKPYIKTRAFYEKNGFIKIDVIDPYPGWNADSPCAIYVKKLNVV